MPQSCHAVQLQVALSMVGDWEESASLVFMTSPAPINLAGIRPSKDSRLGIRKA
jgi:hypothetical protein